jgi:acetate---CoA ligase (ADP-forming)
MLNIASIEEAKAAFEKAMQIDKATGIMIQPQLSGLELFVGAARETGFHPTILCGFGGIFIEIMNAIAAGMAPVSAKEAQDMVRSLKGYRLIQGTRGKPGVNEAQFIEIIRRVSALMEIAPEIVEMDINPLIGTPIHITAVDVRIRIKKQN